MNPLPDCRSSPLMGHSTMNGAGYPDGQGQGAPPPGLAPPPPLPPQDYLSSTYQEGPVYALSYYPPPTTAYPTDYYHSGKFGDWTDESSSKFTRLVFATVITLIISMGMASLIIWVLFGVNHLDFEVASFSVSNLAISTSAIQATWIANMTVTNPNYNLKVNSESIKASILYKDYPLAMSEIEPNYTQKLNEELNQVNFCFKMKNETSIPPGALAAEVAEAVEAGALVVSLRIASGSKFISNDGLSQTSLRIFCEDLKLLISPNGVGNLAEDSPRNCILFV